MSFGDESVFVERSVGSVGVGIVGRDLRRVVMVY
jgi:hypothetical protein